MKTEFCTEFEKPLILDFEEGSKGKVTYRIPIKKWIEVKKYVKQLISDKELKNKFNTICFDTVNYALSACKQYIIDRYQQDHPDKVIDTFNKIPYGGGWELLENEFKEVINNLKRAGYGVVLVAHIKDKVFNRDTDTEYIKTVPDLTDRERNIISAMADFLLLGNFETEIVEPAKKNDEGKIIKEAVVKTKRVLYLRTNENTEAGFRWKNVPEKIPFDFKEFKKVFSEAVQEEIEHGKKKFGLSNDETNSIREKLDEIKQQEEREIFEQEKLQEIIQDIIATAKEKKNQNVDPNKINEIITLYGDIRKVQDIEKAKEVLEKLKSLS